MPMSRCHPLGMSAITLVLEELDISCLTNLIDESMVWFFVIASSLMGAMLSRLAKVRLIAVALIGTLADIWIASNHKIVACWSCTTKIDCLRIRKEISASGADVWLAEAVQQSETSVTRTENGISQPSVVIFFE
jgi:hypothetical protein